MLFALASVLLLAALACGGGEEPADSQANSAPEQSATVGPGGTLTPTPSGDKKKLASEILAASSQRFEEQVKSLRGDMVMKSSAGGVSFTADSSFAFELPDKMYMKMTLAGMGEMELLLRDDTMYIKVPDQGWMSMSLEGLDGEMEQFQELMSDVSRSGYEDILNQVTGDVEDLGEENLDGRRLTHYRTSINIEDFMSAFGGPLADSVPEADVDGPMTMDFWLDPETELPYKFQAKASFDVESQSIGFEMSMRYLDYNKAVSIPAAPSDAKPFN